MMGPGVRRRDFIALFGSAATWSLAAGTQQPDRVRRIGVLMTHMESDRLAAFRKGLEELGWAEPRNIRMEYRQTLDHELMRRFAMELVKLQPDLIVAQTTLATAAILQETRTIPVVFLQVSDPVGSGFIVSLARPGGNATGFIDLEASLAGKWLELLKEISPGTARAAFLFNPTTAPFSEYYLSQFRAAAPLLGVEAIPAPIRDASDLASAIVAQAREPNGAIMVMPEHFMSLHRAEIVSLANRYRLPAVYPFGYYVALGGLLSYGIDVLDQTKRAATYVDSILKGEKPGNLPVQQPTKFQLVINLATAKALGLTVPPSLIARADEVIEFAQGQSGTASEAKAMLEKAVAELKSNEAAALIKFNKADGGFRDRDLFVFCFDMTAAKITAHVYPNLIGVAAKDIKGVDGSPLGEKVFAAMKEGTISTVSYNAAKLGTTDPVPKEAYVTRVGNQGCGVGYYK